MSDQFKSALVRGLIGGVIFAGSAAFSQLTTGASYKAAGIAAGVAFFGYLILRSGVEGYIDTNAASKSAMG